MIEGIVYMFLTGELLRNNVNYFSSNSLQTVSTQPLPYKKNLKNFPLLESSEKVALAAIDMGSQKILLDKNFYRPQQIASLTKIMTTLVILEEHQLDEVVIVSPLATKVIGAQIDLYAYEQLTVKTLIEAMLIPSANDAAIALAIFNAGSEEKFVEKMNKYARKWGLSSAEFFNASGLDTSINKKETLGGNTMSAYDVAQMTRRALKLEFFRSTVEKGHFFGQSIDENFSHSKPTTNQLFGSFLNLKGVKTGYTELAGQCLVTLGVNNNGQEILTIILGSEDRFTETQIFLSWVYDSFEWR